MHSFRGYYFARDSHSLVVLTSFCMAESFQCHMQKLHLLIIEACHGEMSLTKIRRGASLGSAFDKWCSLKDRSPRNAFCKRESRMPRCASFDIIPLGLTSSPTRLNFKQVSMLWIHCVIAGEGDFGRQCQQQFGC
jgi:hypothetical protein